MSSQDNLKKLFDKETELREQLKEQQTLQVTSEKWQAALLTLIKEAQDKQIPGIPQDREEQDAFKKGLANALSREELAAEEAKKQQEGLKQEIQKTELAAQEEQKKALFQGEIIVKADYTTQEERLKQEQLKEDNRQLEKAELSLAAQIEEQKKDVLAREKALKEPSREEERKHLEEFADKAVDGYREKLDEKNKNEKQFNSEVRHRSDGGWYKGIDIEGVDVTAIGLFVVGSLIHTVYEKFKDWRDKTEKTIEEGLTSHPPKQTARDNAALELSSKEEMEFQQQKKQEDAEKKALEAKFDQIEKKFKERNEFTDPVEFAKQWEELQKKFDQLREKDRQKLIDQRQHLHEEQERRREREFGAD